MSDIVDKLSTGEAAATLRFEAEIASWLMRPEWTTFPSHYFTDPTTGKSREIDVWSRSYTTYRGLTRFCTLLVECKSMVGYHLLFASRHRKYPARLSDWWIGNDDDAQNKLVATLREKGIAEVLVSEFRRFFRKQPYCDGAYRIWPVSVDAPDAPVHFCAFRETNIGLTKEIDASVLWKAAQQVRAAVTADRKRTIDGRLEDLALPLDQRIPPRRPEFSDFLADLGDQLKWLHVWHPVVVVDCNLWEVSDSSVKPLTWCRVSVSHDHEDVMPWIDVVNRSAAKKYFAAIQLYYEQQRRRFEGKGVGQKKSAGLTLN